MTAVLLIGMIGILSWQISQRSAEEAAWVAHTYDVSAELEHALRDLDDVETGARGFALTGLDQFLQPYRSGVQASSSELEILGTLISDDAGQEQRLGVLKEQERNRLQAAADLVQARKDLATVPGPSYLDRGKKLMDDVRATVGGMEAEEKLLLQERTQRLRKTQRIEGWTVGTGSILGIIFLFVGGAVINRESRTNARSQARVRFLNADLDRRVKQRTEQLELEAAAHRETELKLLESERMFRLLLDGIKDFAIYMLDSEGRVISWNAGAVRIEGYQGEEIIGKNISCFYTATDLARNAPQLFLQEALKSGRFEGEGWRVRKDGTTFWANAVITPLYGPDRTLSGYSTVVRDTSARKRADDELKRQASLLDLAHDAILVRDLESRVIYWNRGAQHLYGWSAGEAAGRVTHEFLQTVFPSPLAEIENVIAYKGEWEGELHHQTRSGGEVIVASRWSVQRDGNGAPTAILEINRDITAAKLTETALGESEGRLAGVIASAMDSIITVDDKQCILLFNRAAEKMFRCVASEALGQPITRFIPQRFHAAHAGHIRKFGELGITNRAMGSADALWAVRADGQEFQIEASISQVVTGGKKLFTVILRDISERVQAQQTLLEAQARMSGIVGSAMDAIITVDSQQRILVFNAAAMKIFRCSEAEALGETIEQFIPHRFQTAHAAPAGEDGQIATTNRAVSEPELLSAVRADGERFQVEASISQVEVAGQRLFTVILRDVTERKQAEYARERLAAVVDSSDDAIMSTSLDGNIAAWNRGAEKVFGYSAIEIVGKPLLLLLPPENLDEAANLLARTWSGESFEHFETVRVRKDGASINVSVTISPIRDGDGVVVGASAIARDITDRKRAEEALRDKERLLSESQRIAHIGSWSFDPSDPDGKIAWSEELFRIYGVSPDTFVPTVDSLLNLLVSEDRREMRKWIVACMNGEKPGELEFRALPPHGKIRVFRGRGELQNKLGGAVLLVGTVQDVTEQREVERELSAQAELLDLSHDVIMVRELDGRIRFWNRGAEETYGYLRKEVIGAISHELLQTGFSRPHIEIEKEFLQRGRWEGELTHTTHTGKRIVVESRWVLQRDKDGRPSHVMEANNDITERKEAEEASRRARVEAEEANRAKSNFLANMSHEIRTPMNAIIGMTYLALRAQPDPEQRRYLSKISGAADSLLAIINDILDFSKMEAGKMELENVPFSLTEVLSNLEDIVMHAARQKNIAVVFSTAPGVPPYLLGDPLRLGQILINLVNNAIKFTEAGQVTLEVSAEEVREGTARLRFCVADTGIGMSGEQVSKLFQSFNQADASHTRNFGGTGLGLAISKQLCDLMRGTLTVESEFGKGSTFILKAEFPLATDTVQVHAAAEDFSVPRKRSILIVDDDQNDRQTLSGVLNAHGFRVKDVASGEEALYELSLSSDAGQPFDLVLMDWRMPGIDGIETARLIKAHSDWARIPAILMLTAFDREEVMENESSTGLSGFLVKPVRGSFLVDTIEDIFRREIYIESNRRAFGLAARKVNGPANLAGRRVLLVEDNELNRDLAGELLADLGISVTMAVNGRDGADRVLTEPFDLVLMDIQMPVMDGLAASRLIRTDPRFLKLPIIAMTAHAMKGDQKQSLDAGMNDHLTKPINPDTLTRALLKWISVKPEQSIATEAPKTEAVQDDSYMPEELAPFDIRAALRRTNGKPKLLRKLMRSFRNQFAHAGTDLRQLMDEGKREEAERLAHTLKGVARTLEASALGDAAFAVEKAIRLSDEPNVEPLIVCLEKMLTPAIVAAASLEVNVSSESGIH